MDFVDAGSLLYQQVSGGCSVVACFRPLCVCTFLPSERDLKRALVYTHTDARCKRPLITLMVFKFLRLPLA